MHIFLIQAFTKCSNSELCLQKKNTCCDASILQKYFAVESGTGSAYYYSVLTMKLENKQYKIAAFKVSHILIIISV